jgi:hypothetical protein
MVVITTISGQLAVMPDEPAALKINGPEEPQAARGVRDAAQSL